MPKSWVENAVKDPLSIAKIGLLKCTFGVSWQAIINRLAELNMCSKFKIDAMFYQWSKSKNKGAAYHRQQFNYCTSIKVSKEMVSMAHFEFPKVDDKLRFLSCPICGNKNNQAIYWNN